MPLTGMPPQNAVKIPVLLKHNTYAVFLVLKGDIKKRFTEAFAIARSRLHEYGYLTSESVSGPVEKISLTSKGVQRNNHHTNEGAIKSKRFDAMYRQYIAPPPKKPAEKKGG